MTENEAIKHLKLCKESRLFIPNNDVLDIAIQSLKKQIPKMPKYQGEHEKCPTCGSFYIEDYCAMCGQKINRD